MPTSSTLTETSPAELYLDLLKRSLTNTLFAEEPDCNQENQRRFLFDFVKHYMQGSAISMLPLARFDNIQYCIEHVLSEKVPGDIIETGVWRGGATIFMRAALKAYGATDRRVWVADSFEGLPTPDADKYPKEAEVFGGPMIQKACNRLEAGLEEVQANFQAYHMLDDQVRFLKGWFKDTLPTAPIDKLAVMRLDGDYYESTMDALVNLYDKLSIGGYVIIDDYGQDTWTYCQEAVDEFRKDRNIEDPMVQIDSTCFYWKRTP